MAAMRKKASGRKMKKKPAKKSAKKRAAKARKPAAKKKSAKKRTARRGLAGPKGHGSGGGAVKLGDIIYTDDTGGNGGITVTLAYSDGSSGTPGLSTGNNTNRGNGWWDVVDVTAPDGTTCSPAVAAGDALTQVQVTQTSAGVYTVTNEGEASMS